ncbi:hypothetical protein ACFV2S_34530 [Streptomyces sp. NPDC059695]|uniref:hypothetical protein n=1 Tax=Streptomyces sp. NPDC059695 TaxID=3346910 RepID=UPI003698B00B
MPPESRFLPRARRARAQILALLPWRPPRTDCELEELLRLVEAAALHTAAQHVLLCLRVPTGLSKEKRAGWRAARSAAVLALVAEAERLAPLLPPAPETSMPAVPDVGDRWGLDWSQDHASTAGLAAPSHW